MAAAMLVAFSNSTHASHCRSFAFIRGRKSLDKKPPNLCFATAAWCFFVGTLMYWNNPSVGPFSYTENYIAIWMLGSLLFSMGGCFLAYRHVNGM